MTKKMITMDGNEAAADIAYRFTEIAGIYPITPSSPMAEHTDAWSAKGRTNLLDQTVQLVEMQSEAGAISIVHGALQTGALATSYTSSQGLLLMIPVMHRISGERLPGVLHVASRTVGTHALSIFGDHSDVMNCRQTGFAMLCSGSVQEICDLGPIAHLAAIKGRIPFLHFFDGFRTSHELAKVEVPSDEFLGSLIDYQALEEFRTSSLNPERPRLRATVQNPDIYFQVREANHPFYAALPAMVEEYMERISEETGRVYHLFNYYGAKDATRVVIAMGSVSGTIREAVDALMERGEKVGFIQVHLYRPFSMEHFLKALPSTVEKIAVLDRTKEMGSSGEPLYQDICTTIVKAGRDLSIVGGRYGLSSKDTDPMQILSVFANLQLDQPKGNFTIGIEDDVNGLSLPSVLPVPVGNSDLISCKFWGLGGDGTVGANKNTVQILNETTDLYAQAYFEFDAKKSYGVTKSHLKFSKSPIRGSYYVKQADFLACHNQSYINQYDIIDEILPGGTFLLNCTWKPEELEENLPATVKRKLAEKQISFYTIDATEIALGLGLGGFTNTVLQAAFFALFELIPLEDALIEIKGAIQRTYASKGEEVVNRNLAAVDAGVRGLQKIEIPEYWKGEEETPRQKDQSLPEVVTKMLIPINAQKGDEMPVSAFKGYEDGAFEMGMTAFEKRGIASRIPKWIPDNCIQCNQCSFVCPHAVIRPYLLDEQERKAAPKEFPVIEAIGSAAKGMGYSLQVSPYDCTGCGSCVHTCPAPKKALELIPANLEPSMNIPWEYAQKLSDKGDLFNPLTIKGSQFRKPLLEFSAACAGCGETPYAKLMTQLFGDRVYWANATGCSQAWGSPMPGIPYTVNDRGHGPAWSNSLFENNAEFNLGMLLSVRQQREAQRIRVNKLMAETDSDSLKAAGNRWLETYDDLELSREASDQLIAALEQEGSELANAILRQRDQLAKKTFWMFGGDGWAYDIGFGGLDHVLASGEDINAFIVDTEVYSNTGGQSSKATPIGAVAQFASSGKPSHKKDLGAMLMTYGNVYVAQVSMGANYNQLIKAIKEAIEYKGPSVIIAYAPCIAHGIKQGMDKVQTEMKRAVESGYWILYRYNPDNPEAPLVVDSKEPTLDFEEFLNGETRYASLKRSFPENAEILFRKGREEAVARYKKYRKLERSFGDALERS
ncbi:MAG: pyruvate:ferredoxin (flavodoxin) oxidoreductase, partial [Tissierellia bacterium]|nr:pyruvate:ferredoxin (flavodoxin) oxidoreductase [Tissierellia bacterium]